MEQINTKNERLKRAYIEHRRDLDQNAEATLRAIEKAIRRFEEHTRLADFATFDKKQAMAFREALAVPRGGTKQLSLATIRSTLRAVQEFFRWLSLQPGMKSRIKATDVAYLRLSEKDARAAAATPTKTFATMEQLKLVLETMPAGTVLERRDRAVFALIMLTGARDDAVASLRLRNVDLTRSLLVQDPASVRTKASKLIESVFLPLGESVERAFADWIAYLRADALYGPDDPVFPQTVTRIDPQLGPVADKVKPVIWSNAAPIRTIFKRAFAAAGLPYHSPHRVRNSIVEFAYRTSRTPEEFKAFSQNLGHANVATTLLSYGQIPLSRQMELIRNAGKGEDREEELRLLMRQIAQKLG